MVCRQWLWIEYRGERSKKEAKDQIQSIDKDGSTSAGCKELFACANFLHLGRQQIWLYQKHSTKTGSLSWIRGDVCSPEFKSSVLSPGSLLLLRMFSYSHLPFVTSMESSCSSLIFYSVTTDGQFQEYCKYMILAGNRHKNTNSSFLPFAWVIFGNLSSKTQ